MSLAPYVFPPFPSHQVKVVQEYLKYLSILGVPVKTKIEDLGFLKELQGSLNGKTLQLKFTVYSVDDGVGKTWLHGKIDTLDLEVVYFFQFGKGSDAYKITFVREFVDSKKYLELNPTAPAST
ncbi:hypothetical protein BJV78DRAFT_261101 [Lactifluus subvellereus]|nr:hypothetical protein BJV78DRAFT_261101 [Lactifluus subvellereus]